MVHKYTKSVLKVLDCTKSNKSWYDDKELIAGYHTVSIQGEKVKGQRDPEKRLAKVDIDFTGKRVLDVGCSNGGLLHALTDKIAFGVGVDFNAKCINAANVLKAANERSNIHFYTFDLDKEELSMLRHFIFDEPVDVCLFFNLSIWVKRWKEAFTLCSELSETMLFEAHGNDKQQEEQIAFVKSIYQDVSLLSEQSDDDPTYAKRKMYRCEGKVERNKVDGPHGTAEFLKVFSEKTVKEAYEKVFPDQTVKSIRFFPNTHESVVAEVNEGFILKLPKPHRGLVGLNAEQAVTDFMRKRLTLAIPALSVHIDPVPMGRYQKLPGNVFDKKRYAKSPEQTKSSLASQLAGFIAMFHSISDQELKQAKVPLAPSWDLSIDLIEEQFGSGTQPVIRALMPEVIRNHKALSVPQKNQVFGHFDLHGANMLLDENHSRILGVIDFGNCKMGDLHQDLSVMNLSSPDLAERIARSYEKITERKLNRLLIQHYTTIFYLNLLAGLKSKKSDSQFNYWLGELASWYQYLLRDRAKIKLNQRKPVSSLSNSWRKWLASNMIKGMSVANIQKILDEKGFSGIDSATEIMLAEEHPYVEAGKEILNILKKREWLLNTCNTLASLDKRYSEKIEKRKTPDFQTFIHEYYSKHLPVVLTHGVDHWPALEKWTPEFLLEQFGDKEIEIQFDREQDPLYERNSGKHKKRMLMREFITLIEQGESNNHYMTANNTKNSFSSLEQLFKDVADFGEGYRQSDTIHSDNFFWFGPKGTFTPIHHDLTNNMIVQIYGRKKVTLIPAMQVPNLYNDKGVFSAAEFPDFDPKRHPLMKNITPVETIIHPGESIFIPVGWWHCVESLDVSISSVFTDFNTINQTSLGFPRG